MSEMTWQPIGTAPKNGKCVLISGGTFDWDDNYNEPAPFSGVTVAYWDPARLNWHGGDIAHDEWFEHWPTHWMPLPSPVTVRNER